MADKIEQRDFFISFNSADLAYAEAINAALRDAKFTTFFHPADIEPGETIPKWMDDALMNSNQMLALCSPEYFADEAVYSEAERYARFWQDARGAKFKLVPVELRKVVFPPLMAIRKRIDATNRSPVKAAETVVDALKKPEQSKEREEVQQAQPLPFIFNALYRPNPNFTGRFEAMESLQSSLRAGGNAAITAVAGLGGVGKTTLAAEYCHRFGSQYAGVWWVRAEQESVMLADLVELGHRLKLEQTGNIETDARATLEFLRVQPKRWLTVYDNAPNPDAVRKWLPAGDTRCIITSRFISFDDIAPVTRVDQWSDELTADYLLVRTGRKDKDGALRLSHTLGGLPLAAEQAAVFLKDRKGISFDDYANELAQLIKKPRPLGSKGEYPNTVYAAFVKSLEALHEMNGGKIALDLLRLCAFLSPDGVDLALVTVQRGDSVLPADFAASIADKFTREDVLATLTLLSLLRQEDGPAGLVLIFHRLLLEVMRDWMGADARESWERRALALIRGVFPSDAQTNPSSWPLCARLMPHVVAVAAHSGGQPTEERGILLYLAAAYLAQRGDRKGALVFAEESALLVRPTGKPETFVSILNNLGSRRADVNQFDEAESAYQEALAILESQKKDTPQLPIILSNLGQLYLKKGEFSKAEPLLLRAADVERNTQGEHTGTYALRLSNLGALYGELARASSQPQHRLREEEYTTRSLETTRSVFGVRHPHSANRYNNLGVMKAIRNEWSAAAMNMEFTVAIMLSLDLAEHPHTQQAMHSLLQCWEHAGEAEKAKRFAAGDISDLLPVITQIEAEHRAWVAEEPNNRHFGPPSPFN